MVDVEGDVFCDEPDVRNRFGPVDPKFEKLLNELAVFSNRLAYESK